MQANCLLLFSGGLDSILAYRILENNGIKVFPIKFFSSFFASKALEDPFRVSSYLKKKYSINCHLVDISEPFLKILLNPPHGYGKNLNPCVDCKILMVKTALNLLDGFDASFIATGEVPGQRPMSQRTETMRIIEVESGAKGLLLRPLAASLFKPTIAEKQGLFSSSMFPAITGRGRKQQIALARSLGVADYPSPSGGCVLSDPEFSKRFRRFLGFLKSPSVNDCILARRGRHFMLPGGSWLIMGRNHEENVWLEERLVLGDISLKLDPVPGPFGLLRRYDSSVMERDLKLAVEIMNRFTPKRVGAGIVASVRKMVSQERYEVMPEVSVTETPPDKFIDNLRI